jgi:uncharacterized repeat protein (TIGR01451 family)
MLFSSALRCVLLLLCAVNAFGQTFGPADAMSPRAELFFEENKGQFDPVVRFIARTTDCDIRFSAGAVSFVPHDPSAARLPVTIELHTRSRVVGERLLPVQIYDYRGKNRTHWWSHIRGFAAVRYENVAAGIDLLFYGNAGRLEFDIIVKPGARPENIAFRLKGTGLVRRMKGGGLAASSAVADLIFHAPSIYQEIGGRRISVDGGFDVSDRGRIGFRVGPYDPARPLIIDPVLLFSTYWRGSDLAAVGLDPFGNLFLVQPNNGSITVSKFTAGGALAFLTTLSGGSGASVPAGAATDANGNLYIAGSTNSPDFPVTTGAFQTTFHGPSGISFSEGFVAKLASDGRLVYSTYFGGAKYDQIHGIAVDAGGAAYVTGQTDSTDLPLIYRAMPTCHSELQGLWDAFIAKLSPDGSALLYSTYLCGTGTDIGTAIVVSPDGSAHVGGTTTSADFPVTAGAVETTFKNLGGFVAKLSRDGSALLYSTFRNGAAVRGIGLDAQGDAYVTGFTDSRLTQCDPAIGFGGSNDKGDIFLDKLSADGSRLLWSKLLAGSGDDCAFGIGVTPAGTAVVAGKTHSLDYPVVNAMHPVFTAARRQVVVSAVDSTGKVIYSTHWGGTADGTATAIAVGPSGNAYVAGSTFADDVPLLDPFLTTRQSQLEPTPFISAFSIAPGCADLAVTLDASADRVVVPGSVDYTITVTNRGPDPAPQVWLISDELNFVINTPDSCQSRGFAGMFRCALGTLAPGARTVVSVRGDVQTETVPQEVRLHAQSSAGDCDLSNNVASLDVTGLRNGKLSGYMLPSGAIPDTRVGTISDPSTFRFFNIGTQPLTFVQLSKEGRDPDQFSNTTDCGSTLPVGESCGVTVRFAPTSAGPKDVAFLMQVDDNRGPLAFTKNARAVIGASLMVTPASLAFPEQDTGTISAPQTIQVKNRQDSIVRLIRIEATGAFGYTHTCEDDRVTYLNTCQFSVTFRPFTAGIHSGTLTITDDTGDPPIVIGLSATARGVAGNPVPTVHSLSPDKLDFGSDAFTLTIHGAGFVNGTEVWWNGSKRMTTFVGSTQLTSSIPAADLTRPQAVQVTVFNPGPGGGLSNALVLNINAGPRRRSVRH